MKLVREGALPLSGDAGIGDVREEIAAGLGPAPGGGSAEEVDVWDEFRAHALSFIDPAKVQPMKVVVDGGNGMAGPMVGPTLEQARRSSWRRCTSSRTASSPTTSRTRCWRRTGG